MKTGSVKALLEDIRLVDEDRFQLVEGVRASVRALFGDLQEEVKYGGILFSTAGVQFGGVFAYKDHVTVEFSKGAAIDDAWGHLEGAGKGRRHLKLRSHQDIGAKKLLQYLPLALQAARSQA